MVECTSKEIRAIKMVETLSLVNNTDEPRGHYIASTWTLFLCDLILIWNLKSWPHGSWEDDDAYQRPKAGRRVRSRESLVRDTMSASGGKMPLSSPWRLVNSSQSCAFQPNYRRGLRFSPQRSIWGGVFAIYHNLTQIKTYSLRESIQLREGPKFKKLLCKKHIKRFSNQNNMALA